MFSFLSFISLVTFAWAAAKATSNGNCVGTISSLSDVSAAVQCKTVNINAFTVQAGKTFTLDLLQGTTVNVYGGIQFDSVSSGWSGPLFVVKGENITFNGNGQVWDGNGPSYWDGIGGNGGITKPKPMMRIQMSGTFSDVYILNCPANCVSVYNINIGPLVVNSVFIDNSQGNYPNERSHGLPAGHNTDGFDVSGEDLVIKNCVVYNQDDCIAINRGQNIVFENNYCDGGHGASIGSISSNAVVDGIIFQGNTIVNSRQAFRIKTDKTATNSRVANVTYSDNTAKNCTDFGVLITQSYPASTGEPGNGVQISNINFSPKLTDIEVMNGAKTVTINCGQGSCDGDWVWSSLQTSGGEPGSIKNCPSVTGYSIEI